MQHKLRFKKITIISLISFLIFNLLYCMNVHAMPFFTKQGDTLGSSHVIPAQPNIPIPDLRGGSERSHRKPYHNPPYKNIVFYTANTSKKLVALTFDDGPDTRFTPEILDVLKRNKIKATFFIVGKRAQADPDMVKRIARDGHAIGNHSWDHPDLDKLSYNEISSKIHRTENTLTYLLGYHPALVRPPYGAADLRVIKELGSKGYKIIDWSVDTRDWAGTPSPNILLNVRKEMHPGCIVLEHCAGGKGEDLSNTVTALPQIIKEFKANGYQFVTIPELLGISPKL